MKDREFFISIKFRKRFLFYVLYYTGKFLILIGAKKQAKKFPIKLKNTISFVLVLSKINLLNFCRLPCC